MNTTATCDVCNDNPATEPVADMCTPCYNNFVADVSRAHATDPTSPDRRYVTSDELARDIRSSVVYDTAPSMHTIDADIMPASRDASGAGFVIMTSTGQTFRVVVSEVA